MSRSLVILTVVLLIAGVSPAEWQLTTHGVCSPSTIATDSTGNRILLGVFRGGYWLTENGGQDWTQLNSRMTDSDLLQVNSQRNAEAVDPQADTLMINVWGHQPFEGRNQRHTRDGGGSFSRLEDIADVPDTVTALTLNTPATILRHRPGKAYLLGYSDFAILENEEWTIVNLLPWCQGVQDMFVEQARPDTVYAFGRWGQDQDEHFGGVLSSYDGGHNWTRLTRMEELTEEEGFVLALKRLNGDTLIAMTLWQQGYTNHPPFLWSTDGGTNWEWIESSGLPDWMATSTFEVCPERPGRILFGGGTPLGVWESNDYGQTWQRLLRGLPEVPAISAEIYRNPYSDHLYILLNGQGVYCSTDQGDSWQQVTLPPIGVSAWAYDGLLVQEDGRFEVTNNSDLFFSLDDSDVFAQIPRPVSDTDVSWLFPISLTPDEIVVTCLRAPFWLDEPVEYFSIWNSYDQGDTWEEGPETEWTIGTSPITWFTFADSVLISGRFGPTYKISHDNGENWETHDPGFIYQYMRPMGDILYLVKQYPQGDVMRSVDFGETWESMDFPDPDLIQIPDAEILDLSDTLYVNAHGQTWSYYPPWDIWQPRGELPTETWDLYTLNWDMVAGPSDTLMIAGANQRHQLFISEDCGWSWYEQPIELPGDYHGETCWQLKYDKWRDRLWIDTGYGLAYKDNPTSAVGEEVWTFIPANYVTLDAYPNPFNISSTIRYSLQRPADIKLDVFDILGRQVATLAEGLVAPGEHRARFDASSLASGVYFVQLDTGSETVRRKIVLMK